jgi:hypothetical protein
MRGEITPLPLIQRFKQSAFIQQFSRRVGRHIVHAPFPQ